MKEIFEIIGKSDREGKKTTIRIGIRVSMAGHETLCPVTEACSSYQGAQVEVERLKRDLDEVLERAKRIFREDSSGGGLGLTAGMSAEQVWTLLSKVTDDEEFLQGFNGLDETRRREVAEHVLTRCNIFSGRAAFFSARYDESSGLMG